MITGNMECKIREYIPIDRLGEGFGWVRPEEGEEIIGIPYQWHSENSTPFIEHRMNGVVTKTVNASDLSEIVFEVES